MTYRLHPDPVEYTRSAYCPTCCRKVYSVSGPGPARQKRKILLLDLCCSWQCAIQFRWKLERLYHAMEYCVPLAVMLDGQYSASVQQHWAYTPTQPNSFLTPDPLTV